ncbi:MAG: GxxExxY protein [Limisphaerales bacterium]
MKNASAGTARQRLDDLSGEVIGLCIEIHRKLGPGLIEGQFSPCLCASVVSILNPRTTGPPRHRAAI